MVEMTSQSPELGSCEVPQRLPRFSTAERWLHRTTTAITFVLFATGAALFLPAVSVLVGNRPLVSDVHIISGFLLPIPLLLALASSSFRKDTGLLNRFTATDWHWLRSRDRRSGRIRVGKFNAGQKLNAAFTLGWILVLLATGSIMFFGSWFPDDIRTGATFVHDWLSLAVVVVVAGHTYMALRDAEARTGMRTGAVTKDWAAREHSLWLQEVQDSGNPAKG
jgi:formate dehydrogenase subunit gamma